MYELHAQDGGVLLRAWVPFTKLRPPAPEDFGSVASSDGAIDGSCPLEHQYRGGWYQLRDDASLPLHNARGMHVLTARRYRFVKYGSARHCAPRAPSRAAYSTRRAVCKGGARTPGHQVYVSREDSDCLKLQGDIKKLMAADDHRSLRLCCRRIAPLELVAY